MKRVGWGHPERTRGISLLFFFFLSLTAFSEDRIQFFYNMPPDDHPDGRGVRAAFIEQIDLAQESLEGAFYQVNDPKVIDALLGAVDRGVRVEMVTDTDWVEHKDYRQGYARLKKGGVKVVDDRKYGLSHNKYCIIDRNLKRARVWMGSTNLTTQCHLENGNASFLLISPEVASIFYLDFKQMIGGKFQREKEGVFQDSFSYPRLSIDGVPIEIYFSPRHNIERKVVEALYGAKESIHFATYTLDNAMIYRAILNKAKMPEEEGEKIGKVPVYGIMNRLGSSKGPYQMFLDHGIPVRLSAFTGALHHKFMIIDKEILILGSYNFSASAERENDESVIIIRSKPLVEEFYTQVFVPSYQQAYPEYVPAGEELEEYASPRKEIAISEIHFLPKKGRKGWKDNRYVEVHNYATCSTEAECEEESIDLRGWKLWNGLVPWHPLGKIRGTTDTLASYYHDPYENRHGMNHERYGYFLKRELEILRPGEYALIVGRQFDMSYLDQYREAYEKQFEKIYGRKPKESYEKYPKLFVSAMPSDRELGNGLKPFQFVTLFYPDKFTMGDRFTSNFAFLKDVRGGGDILEQVKRRKKFEWTLLPGQSLERIQIDRERLSQPYEPFFEVYENRKYFLYWHGLATYNEARDWEPNREGLATPGF